MIRGTREMDRFANSSTLVPPSPYSTLHPGTVRHLEIDGTARCIDGSPNRTSIYHALLQAPLLHIQAICDLFSFGQISELLGYIQLIIQAVHEDSFFAVQGLTLLLETRSQIRR